MGVAYISFEFQDDIEYAMKTKYILRQHKLIWTNINQKTCTYCHKHDHLIANCPSKSIIKKSQIKWNVEQHSQPTTSTYPNQYK